MDTTVIVGDSNITALQRSIPPDDGSFQLHYVVAWVIKEFVLTLADGGSVINPLIRIPLAASGLYATTDTPIPFSGNLVIMLGSSLCNNVGLLAELNEFKFYSADGAIPTAVLHDERPVFSSALCRDIATEQCELLGSGLMMMASMWPQAKIYLLAGPPPFADDSKAKSALGLLDIPDPAIRLHLYNANMLVLHSLAAAASAEYIGVPMHLRDAAGFLREEYNADGFHGNVDYGREMVARLKQALSIPLAE